MTTPEAGEVEEQAVKDALAWLDDAMRWAVGGKEQEAFNCARRAADCLLKIDRQPLVVRAALAARMAEALRGARRILSIYVTDESPALDILDANAIDGVLADWDRVGKENPRG